VALRGPQHESDDSDMSRFFVRLGTTAWVLFLGLALLCLLVETVMGFGPSRLAWKFMIIVLGGGGLACFALGTVATIWERR